MGYTHWCPSRGWSCRWVVGSTEESRFVLYQSSDCLLRHVVCVCALLVLCGVVYKLRTVEPPNKGHALDPALCPLYGGCPLSEVILHKVCIQVYLQLVHCSEVCPLLKCPLLEVSLYIYSVCVCCIRLLLLVYVCCICVVFVLLFVVVLCFCQCI